MMVLPMLHLTILALIGSRNAKRMLFFRYAENAGKGIAGNRNPIVHTADAFDPTAPEAARMRPPEPRPERQGGR
jgi:hypothetical protein